MNPKINKLTRDAPDKCSPTILNGHLDICYSTINRILF